MHALPTTAPLADTAIVSIVDTAAPGYESLDASYRPIAFALDEVRPAHADLDPLRPDYAVFFDSDHARSLPTQSSRE